MKAGVVGALVALAVFCSARADTNDATSAPALCLWYQQPAGKWEEALPLGNGRLGAMVFGTIAKERLQLNEESLWAGCPVQSWPPDFPKHLAEVRRLLFAGMNAEAHPTATSTSFRSYEPLADLWLDFGAAENVTGYRRELILADGIARVTFRQGDATMTREAFISAPDNVLAVRVTSDKPGALAFAVSLTRQRSATVTATADSQLHLHGQIADVEKKSEDRNSPSFLICFPPCRRRGRAAVSADCVPAVGSRWTSLGRTVSSRTAASVRKSRARQRCG